MASLLITFAVKEEAVPFLRKAQSRPDVQVMITGMGRRHAERALDKALGARSPGAVLTCGFAGGLNPELPTGAVVFAADEGFDRIPSLLRSGARPGTFHCAERVAVTVGEKRALREQTAADAVEMESGVIRRICRERGIASATVRAISDPASEDLPLDFNRLMDAGQNLQPGRLLRAVLSDPWKIGGLLHLRKNTRLAAESLARVLLQIIGDRPSDP